MIPMTQFLMLHLARSGDEDSVAMRLLLRIPGGLGFLRCRIRLQACRRDRGAGCCTRVDSRRGKEALKGNFPIRMLEFDTKAFENFQKKLCILFHPQGFPLTVRVNQEFQSFRN